MLMPVPQWASKKTRFSNQLAGLRPNYEGRIVAEFVKLNALIDRIVTGTETATLVWRHFKTRGNYQRDS